MGRALLAESKRRLSLEGLLFVFLHFAALSLRFVDDLLL
jgi:hypothetical protein